jgi:hypothetical protein
MAKVKNIKETPKQISEEHLAKLQGIVKEINNMQMQIGGLEAQKHEVLKQLSAGREILDGLRSEMEEAYGDVQIDINTGAIIEDATANS